MTILSLTRLSRTSKELNNNFINFSKVGVMGLLGVKEYIGLILQKVLISKSKSIKTYDKSMKGNYNACMR